MEQRARISAALQQQDLPAAADAYAALLEQRPDQTLPQASQLDLANQFMEQGRHALAARAYELMLKAYPTYHDRGQIHLILGLLYARYLDQPAKARETLTLATHALDGEHRELAHQALRELLPA